MRPDWQESLLKAKGMIEPIKMGLRFGLPWVPISSLAEQFYCEAKVDLEYKYGRIPTPAKDEGTELHEEIIEMEPTTPRDLVESISKKPVLLCTFPVYAQVGDMPIMGMPDAVLFQKSKPSHVIELKTTNGDVTRLWRNQAVQVKAYGLALDLMGFECDRLELPLVRVNKDHMSDELKESLLNTVAEGLLDGGVEAIERSLNQKMHIQLKVHSLPYSKEDAMKDVTWARDYWLMKREPVPTQNPGKCRVCEFNDRCPFFLS